MSDPRDLTTLDAVKAWLNLTSTADDDLLTGLVTAVSVGLETLLGRPILTAAVTETRDGNGGRVMAFAVTPVTAVMAVTVEGRAVPASPDTIAPGYVFSPTRVALLGYRFARGIANIGLEYQAGYDAVPPDLAQAATELVALRYRERGRIGLASRSLAGESAAYLTTAEMPPDAMAAVQRYRKLAPL